MNTILFAFVAALGVGIQARAGTFKDQTIDDRVGIGYGLAVADVNGDQRPDILLVDKAEVAWYENPGWEKHVIAEKLTPIDHVCITAQDIDGDGKAEIAVGAGWNPGDTLNSGAVFYLQPPADRTQKWKAVPLHHEPTVHRMAWVRGEGGKYSLVVAPLHGRGNKNGTGEGVRLLEYIPPAGPGGEWKTNLIVNSLHMSHNLDPVQWDGDPAQEILYCGKEAILLLDRQDGKWSSKELISANSSEGFNGAGEVRLGKAKTTRFVTAVEPMHGTTLAVYPENEKWKRHVLDSKFAEAHALATGDLLHRGSDQIVVGWRNKDAEGKVGIKIFELTDPAAMTWRSTLLDDNGMACEDLKVADLNGDGWLDVIAAGRATKNLKVYWNQGGQQ